MIINVSLDRIQANPWQTRIGEPDGEYIKSLALDIAQNGLLQAPVGRMMNAPDQASFVQSMDEAKARDLLSLPDRFIQLAFGHNRLAAFRWLYEQNDNDDTWDYSIMPIDIRTLDDKQMAIMAWSENEKRRDVSPIERAKGIEQRMKDFAWNQHEVADQLGVARPTISNMLRLLKLPQNIQDALHAGTISARVGSALLPMYELPQSVLEKAKGDWYIHPANIVTKALEGHSSDMIRADVERLYDRWTVKLQGAEFGMDELFTEGVPVLGYDFEGSDVKVYCGICRTCDRRLKDQGNICLDKGCYTAKQTLHRRKYLANAADKCGIKAIDPSKGGNVTPLSEWNSEQTEKIISSKCENLRLEYAPQSNYKNTLTRVDGFPHARIVCDKRNGSCTCIKGLDIQARQGGKGVAQVIQAEKEADPDYEGGDPDWDSSMEAREEPQINTSEVRAQTLDPKQLEEAARQARKEKMRTGEETEKAKQKVLKVLEDAFRDHQPGALYLVAASYPYPNRGDLDLQKIHKRLAGNVVHQVIPSAANTVDELYEIVNKKLEKLELDAVYPYETLVETFERETHE